MPLSRSRLTRLGIAMRALATSAKSQNRDVRKGKLTQLLLLLGLLHTHFFRAWLQRTSTPSEKHRWQLHALMGCTTSLLIWCFT